MNREDRAALYAEVNRILTPKGRFVIHDLVFRDGDVVYPTPWARDISTSFPLSELDTRATLEQAGFKAIFWRDDTQSTLDWFRAAIANSPSGPNLGAVMGPDFPAIIFLIIQVHGWFLRLRNSVGSLPAFAMHTAFPCSDYYAGSAPSIHHLQSPWLAQLRCRAAIRVPMFQSSTFIS